MSHCARTLAVLLAALAANGSALAAADLAGEVHVPGGTNVVAGALHVLELRFHNRGPDRAPFPAMGVAWSPSPGHRTYEVFPIAETPPCAVRYTDFFVPPPDVSTLVANVRYPHDLAPGATLVCRVGMVVFDDVAREVTLRVLFGSTAFDPDESNNRAQVVLSTAPRQIPASSWHSMCFLMMAMLAYLFMSRSLRALPSTGGSASR